MLLILIFSLCACGVSKSDASLSELFFIEDRGLIGFSENKFKYDCEVESGVIALTLQAVAKNSFSRVSVNGELLTKANPAVLIPLSDGANLILVRVLSQDLSVESVYSILVNRN